MKRIQYPSREILHELFEYREGKLYWKKLKFKNQVKVGDEAGSRDKDGYIKIVINKILYKAHSIVWIMFNGDIPDTLEIDHINTCAYDNRIENLQLITHKQNCIKRGMRIDNTTGVKGVTFHKRARKYQASCTVDGKKNYLGIFPTLEEAEQVVKKFREQHHGDFCNHG